MNASSRGFSLIEVMVAILILGVALVALTQGITTALQSNKEAEKQTLASLFAQGQLEKLRAEGQVMDGTTEGDCGDDLPLYSWKQTVSPCEIDGLHEVEIEVSVASTKTSLFSLKSFLFQQSNDSRDTTTKGRPVRSVLR